MGQALEIVNKFYDLTNHRRQTDGLAEMITDDMTFIGPLQTTHGAEAYIAINKQLLQFHAGVNMLHQFEDGNHVCSIYELFVTAPSGDKVAMPMSDWIRVDNGRIAEQRIYYDPREFEQKFAI